MGSGMSVTTQVVIPQVGNLWENLYHLTYDFLVHFGADKSYASLHDNYYWPNMCTDLEKSYIPSCDACQWDKSQTTKPPGPLHPLLIPDECSDSVTLDFIGPLPADKGYNCTLSMTDRLGSNVWIIPTWTDATAEDIALLVFNNWYCENGLPLDWVSNRDKLFMSHLWKAFVKLTGVKLSTYYPKQTVPVNKQTRQLTNWSAFMSNVTRKVGSDPYPIYYSAWWIPSMLLQGAPAFTYILDAHLILFPQ